MEVVTHRAEGVVSQKGNEVSRLVWFLREQEQQMQAQAQEVAQMPAMLDRSQVEALERAEQLEAETGCRLLAAVESERRAARDLSEVRRRDHTR